MRGYNRKGDLARVLRLRLRPHDWVGVLYEKNTDPS
jgi:hypothetical protein